MINELRSKLSTAVVVTLLLSANFQSGGICAQSAAPKTVVDYFLLVPERYIGYDREHRQGLVQAERSDVVVDVDNGFISYKASDNPEEFEFALFKKPDGKYLIAYSVPYDPDFPGATSKLLFLSYNNGKWIDVTRANLPVAVSKQLSYKLPRVGRTILVTDQKGRNVYSLNWAQGKFSVSPK